jgi:hypothetical protein
VRVLLTIILGDSDWFEVLRVGLVGDAGSEGREAIAVVVMVPVKMVPSPCFNNTPRIAAVIDLLPEIDRGSVVKASLKWSVALRPCAMLVARLVSRLLYFLFSVAMRGLVALVGW